MKGKACLLVLQTGVVCALEIEHTSDGTQTAAQWREPGFGDASA